MGKIMFGSRQYEENDDIGPIVIRVTSSILALSMIGMMLRFYAKRIVGQGIFPEDWLLIFTLPFSFGLYIATFYAVRRGGLGHHVIKEVATPEVLNRFLHAVYAIQLTYTISLALTKFSITLMYRRLFKVHRSSNQIMLFDCVLLLRLIATCLVYIFPCTPVNFFWDKTISGKCVNVHDMYLVAAVTNILTDIALVYFPLPIIWSLQLYRAQKLSVYAFFVCAGSVTLISIVRLISIVQAGNDEDITWVLAPVAVWTSSEASFAIFCACIPSMRPIIQLLSYRNSSVPLNGSPSDLQVHKRWWNNLSPSAQDNDGNFKRMKGGIEEPFELYGPRTLITGGELANLHENQAGIQVRHEVKIEHEVHIELGSPRYQDAIIEQESSWD